MITIVKQGHFKRGLENYLSALILRKVLTPQSFSHT